MPATKLGTSGATFGAGEETGVIVKTINRTPLVEVNELANHEGDIIDAAFFRPRADISIQGNKNADSGLGAVAVAGTLTLAGNALPAFGVAGGKIGVISVPTVGNSEGWQDMTINARQYPGIAA